MADLDVVLDGVSVTGGKTVIGESVGGKVLPVSKIRTGTNGTDGGDVTTANPFPVAISDGTNLLGTTAHPVAVDGSHVTQPVSNSFFDVPFSDLATEITLESVGAQIVAALGAVTITSLPAVTFAAPQHVIIDSATLGTVTVSGAVTTSGTATVSGTVAATQSGTWSLGTSAAVIGHVVTDAGSTTAVTALPAIPAGSNAIGSVTVTSAPTTAVTIAALPALTVGSATIGAVTGPSAAPLALDAHLTDGTLRGTVALSAGSAVVGHVVTDTGSTTAVTGNVAVTNTGLTNLDVALSTRALETGGNLATLVTRNLLGQQTQASSRSVTNASDASLRQVDCTPTGVLWTTAVGAAIGATAAGTMVVSAATGKWTRNLVLTNPTASATAFWQVYHGAAPAWPSTSGPTIVAGILIVCGSTAAGATANLLADFPGGLATPSGVTIVTSTTAPLSSNSYAAPSLPCYLTSRSGV